MQPITAGGAVLLLIRVNVLPRFAVELTTAVLEFIPPITLDVLFLLFLSEADFDLDCFSSVV